MLNNSEEVKSEGGSTVLATTGVEAPSLEEMEGFRRWHVNPRELKAQVSSKLKTPTRFDHYVV